MTPMLRIDEILLRLGNTTPTRDNPTPGLSPVTQRMGLAYFQPFEPSTDAERRLMAAIAPMLEDASAAQRQEFREALLAVYLEQGFEANELFHFFPEFDLEGFTTPAVRVENSTDRETPR